jgi:hypothetical protein
MVHPSSEAIRHIERERALYDKLEDEPPHLAIAEVYAQLAIADALVELNRTIHETFATGFLSVEVRD